MTFAAVEVATLPNGGRDQRTGVVLRWAGVLQVAMCYIFGGP